MDGRHARQRVVLKRAEESIPGHFALPVAGWSTTIARVMDESSDESPLEKLARLPGGAAQCNSRSTSGDVNGAARANHQNSGGGIERMAPFDLRILLGYASHRVIGDSRATGVRFGTFVRR
jgi:hypothetical protein